MKIILLIVLGACIYCLIGIFLDGLGVLDSDVYDPEDPLWITFRSAFWPIVLLSMLIEKFAVMPIYNAGKRIKEHLDNKEKTNERK